MKTKLLLLVILLSFSATQLCAQIDTGDSLALVDLYKATKGSGWSYHTNWLTKKPVSTWYGIQTSGKNVWGIFLASNNLTGQIPESIGNFDSLIHLQLGDNKLSGGIPASIGNLATLTNVFLAVAGLTGSLPETIGNLQNLYGLNAAGNKLSGEIPQSLGRCSHLSVLLLDDNQLTGSIPLSFKNLAELTQLTLTSNELSGVIPDAFSPEAVFYEIWLDGNRFSGTIPPYLGNLKHVKNLSLSNNQLTGRIPEELGNLTYIETLNLSRNKLTGGIPKSFSQFKGLSNIILTDNLLSEPVNAQASGRPDRTAIIFAEHNRFTFNGLEYLQKKFPGSSYSPQARLPLHSSNGVLSVSAGGTLSNNTYKWYEAGKASAVVTVGDSVFRPSHSGKYYVKITNSVAQFLTLKTDTVDYRMPLAKDAVLLTLSPNPGKDIITIIGLNEEDKYVITLADAGGYVPVKMVSSRQSTARLDVSRLKTGNYLVTVSDGKTVIKAIQFVKQ